MSHAVESLNPDAESINRLAALQINLEAAKGLQTVLKSNLGPKGSLKMLVGGAGQIKLTKDGNSLLHEMMIVHPTAVLIARAATATDQTVGDGTTSTVLLIGELLKQAERYLSEGLHPRVLVDGFELAKEKCIDILNNYKVTFDNIQEDRDMLINICRTALNTKLRKELANQLTEIVTDAILTIKKDNEPLDLHMVEIMHMQHKIDLDTRLVKGIVLDHGARHPGMPKLLKNAYILTLNVSLEYEKSEVTAGFYYKNAQERERMVTAERKFTDDKVKQIIEFKKQLCNDDNTKQFVVINQKGIDPISLDMLAKEGILALRRAKRRNMERLTLACGGVAVNSVEDLTEDVLGHAELIYEQVLGEDKYTFVEGVKNPYSCTILIKGQNPHTIAQIKDSIRDGLRSVKNSLDDNACVPGAGAFEIYAHYELNKIANETNGKIKLGLKAFAEALLVIPKTLAENSGFDLQETLIKLQDELRDSKDKKLAVGLDIDTGNPIYPEQHGIYDNVKVKQSVINLSTVLASQILLVDEIMRAGIGSHPKVDPLAQMG